MRNIFFILTLVTMVAVFITLVAGIIMMSKGGELNKKYGNKLMQIRVGLQGLAIAFFVIAFMSQD